MRSRTSDQGTRLFFERSSDPSASIQERLNGISDDCQLYIFSKDTSWSRKIVEIASATANDKKDITTSHL